MVQKEKNLEEEVMRQCRRVRQELYGRFKTRDELHAWLMSLDKQPRKRYVVAHTATSVHGAPNAARIGNLAQHDNEPYQDNEVLRRCRQARKDLIARHGGIDAYFDYLIGFEKQQRKGRVGGRATASKRKARRASRNGKPAQKRAAHKA